MSEIEKNNEDWLDITINPNQTKENLIKGDGNLENISDFFSTNVIPSHILKEEEQKNEEQNNEEQNIQIKKPLEIDSENKIKSTKLDDKFFNCRKKCFQCILM